MTRALPVVVAHFPARETIFIIRNFSAPFVTNARFFTFVTSRFSSGVFVLTSRSPLHLSRNVLRWLCAGLAALVLVLAVTIPQNDDELSAPVVAMATVDLEASDVELDLPTLRIVHWSAPTVSPDGEHQCARLARPATRTPSPPDRPPCAA